MKLGLLLLSVLAACGGTVAGPDMGGCCELPEVFVVACFAEEPWLTDTGVSCTSAGMPIGSSCQWCPPSTGKMIGHVVHCTPDAYEGPGDSGQKPYGK